MIEITVQRAARKRKITKAYQLQVEVGLSPAVAADLWQGRGYPRLQTLEKICAAWKCPLDELVRYVPNKAQKSAGRR